MSNGSDSVQPVELLQQLSNEFDARCQERHEKGAQKYGEGTFLDVDTLEMAIEEVLDLANYARYTFVKLRLLQESLETDKSTPTTGPQGFFSLRKDKG